MQGAERRAARDRLAGDARKNLVDDVGLVLEVAPDPLRGRPAVRVPGLPVDAVDADQLDGARLDEVAEPPDQAEVLPLVETAHRRRENQQRPARMTEVENLHLAAEGVAEFLYVVALHLSGGGARHGGHGETSRARPLARSPSPSASRGHPCARIASQG